VEKIIDKIRTQDREMKRQWSSISAVSLALAQSKKLGQNNINANLNNRTSKPFGQNLNFADLVQKAWNQHNPQQSLGSAVVQPEQVTAQLNLA
jgi:hypothetical protein